MTRVRDKVNDQNHQRDSPSYPVSRKFQQQAGDCGSTDDCHVDHGHCDAHYCTEASLVYGVCDGCITDLSSHWSCERLEYHRMGADNH